MALRWCAAGMLEADHQCRRVDGHLHLPKLRAALEALFRNVTAASQNEDRKAHDDPAGRHRSSTELGITSFSGPGIALPGG
jgi:hypothetical protein